MIPFQIIGQPGSGKTTFIAELVRAMCKKNFKIGTIKHSSHAHELDKPSKDSHIHRTAGASPVTMVTRDLAAVYLPVTSGRTTEHLLKTHYQDVDITLIEGWISGPFPKIEVWRSGTNRPPLFPGVDQTIALVTDDPIPEEVEADAACMHITCFKRSNSDSFVRWLLEKANISR